MVKQRHCAVCKSNRGAISGFEFALKNAGIEGRYAHPECVKTAQTAAIHKECDLSLRGNWQCACAPCILIREGMPKEKWLKRFA